jgi:hypothetical protein
MRHRFQAPFRWVLLFHLLEIRVQAIQLLAISRGSRNAPSRTPGHGRYFPGMLLSPSGFPSRSAIRPRNLPSSSSRVSRGYNRAPRGADAADAEVTWSPTWPLVRRANRVTVPGMRGVGWRSAPPGIGTAGPRSRSEIARCPGHVGKAGGIWPYKASQRYRKEGKCPGR